MKLNEILKFNEKYSINFNEFMLAKVISWDIAGVNEELVRDYFYSRICVRGKILEHLQGFKDSGILPKEYVIPERGGRFEPKEVPFSKRFLADLAKVNID